MRRPLTSGLLAGAVLVASSCGAGERADPPWAGPSTDRPASPAPSTTTTPARPSATPSSSLSATSAPASTTRRASPSSSSSARPTTITLAFGGDVHFEDFVRPLASDPHGLDELRDTLGAADLSMVNLESAITERGTPLPGKDYTFRAPEGVLTTLDNAGVDVVGMANNHALDFGLEGFADTLAAQRRSPVPVIGIGADADEAFAPATLRTKGKTVAFVNGDQVLEQTLTDHSAGPDRPGVANALQPDRIVAETRRAARTHDVVVVYLHWGIEPGECPDAASITLSRQLEAAGADVVVGGHTHRVNGAGWVGDAYVAYGLGNFVFYRTDEPSSRTGVLTLTLSVPAERGRPDGPLVRTAAWTPMLIDGDGVPRPPGPADRERLHEVWEQARGCTPARATP